MSSLRAPLSLRKVMCLFTSWMSMNLLMLFHMTATPTVTPQKEHTHTHTHCQEWSVWESEFEEWVHGLQLASYEQNRAVVLELLAGDVYEKTRVTFLRETSSFNNNTSNGQLRTKPLSMETTQNWQNIQYTHSDESWMVYLAISMWAFGNRYLRYFLVNRRSAGITMWKWSLSGCLW